MPGLGRYKNPYLPFQFSGEPPHGSSANLHTLESADGAACHAVLWLPAGDMPETALVLMHPRVDFSRHYLVPGLLEAGYAVFAQNSRWAGNDSMLLHERVLFDVAAGLARLRDLGFERVVLIGNSGGGALFSFYQAQAVAAPEQRLSRTAAGAPLELGALEMPAADAMVYLAAHPGEGRFLLGAIDPSVVDEADPCACNAAIDMYDPANGFRQPPEPARYAEDFLAAYREAQRARVARIDRLARKLVAERRSARAEAKKNPDDTAALRRATAVKFLTVYRTEADPRYTDLSLDPSERDYGSLFGRRPDVINYGPFGFARVVTPEAWLSTWSGLSSHAATADNAAAVDVPSLVVTYSADNAVFPADARAIFEGLGAKDKTMIEAPGDHYGYALPGADIAGRTVAVRETVGWLESRGF